MNITRLVKSTIAAVVVAGALIAAPAAQARVFISAGFAPPAIPIYDQPIAPGYGYIWTPGYWAYGDSGYYWIDGAWVYPPYADALWTPGYWGYGGGGYLWNAGYWGRTVGFYGGINYGFGYFGTGFYGGYWNGGRFFYNSAYNHIGFHNNVYNQRYGGFDGRPGGQSFANRGNEVRGNEGFNHGSSINGNSFANRGGVENRGIENRGGAVTNSFAGNRGGFGATGTSRPEASNGGARSFTGGGNTYARPSAPQSFSQSRGSVSGGSSFGGGSRGGGFSGGGGGGFHGGGGGGSHGGGGRR